MSMQTPKIRRLYQILLSGVIIVSALVAKEKSGVFVGAKVGAGMLEAKNLGNIANPLGSGIGLGYDGDKSEASWMAGAQVGYSHFFASESSLSKFGLRGYVGYEYMGARKIANIPSTAAMLGIPTGSANIAFHEVTLNADVMWNFINRENLSFGVLGGAGVGYSIASLDNKEIKDFFQSRFDYDGFVLPLRYGVSVTIAKHHRIELTGRHTTFATAYNAKENNVTNPMPGSNGAQIFSTSDGVSVRSNFSATIGYNYIF